MEKSSINGGIFTWSSMDIPGMSCPMTPMEALRTLAYDGLWMFMAFMGDGSLISILSAMS